MLEKHFLVEERQGTLVTAAALRGSKALLPLYWIEKYNTL
jgi:hypothetical protein